MARMAVYPRRIAFGLGIPAVCQLRFVELIFSEKYAISTVGYTVEIDCLWYTEEGEQKPASAGNFARMCFRIGNI